MFLVTKGVYKLMKIIPKDSYGNEIDIDESSITVEIRKVIYTGSELSSTCSMIHAFVKDALYDCALTIG